MDSDFSEDLLSHIFSFLRPVPDLVSLSGTCLSLRLSVHRFLGILPSLSIPLKTRRATIRFIVKKCSSLQSLVLPSCGVSTSPRASYRDAQASWRRSFISDMLLSCSRLRVLRMSYCDGDEIAAAMSALSGSALETFDISGSRSVQGNLLELFVSKTPSLRVLDITGCQFNSRPFLRIHKDLNILDRNISTLEGVFFALDMQVANNVDVGTSAAAELLWRYSEGVSAASRVAYCRWYGDGMLTHALTHAIRLDDVTSSLSLLESGAAVPLGELCRALMRWSRGGVSNSNSSSNSKPPKTPQSPNFKPVVNPASTANFGSNSKLPNAARFAVAGLQPSRWAAQSDSVLIDIVDSLSQLSGTDALPGTSLQTAPLLIGALRLSLSRDPPPSSRHVTNALFHSMSSRFLDDAVHARTLQILQPFARPTTPFFSSLLSAPLPLPSPVHEFLFGKALRTNPGPFLRALSSPTSLHHLSSASPELQTRVMNVVTGYTQATTSGAAAQPVQPNTSSDPDLKIAPNRKGDVAEVPLRPGTAAGTGASAKNRTMVPLDAFQVLSLWRACDTPSAYLSFVSSVVASVDRRLKIARRLQSEQPQRCPVNTHHNPNPTPNPTTHHEVSRPQASSTMPPSPLLLHLVRVCTKDELRRLVARHRLDVNATDSLGRNALHILALLHRDQKVRAELIQMLVSLGAQVNVLDHLGRPPLYYALKSAVTSIGRPHLVATALLSSGADQLQMRWSPPSSAHLRPVIAKFKLFPKTTTTPSLSKLPSRSLRRPIGVTIG